MTGLKSEKTTNSVSTVNKLNKIFSVDLTAKLAIIVIIIISYDSYWALGIQQKKKKKKESSVGKRLKRVTSYNVETIFNEPLDNHSLHPSPPLSAVRLSLLPNLKKGGGAWQDLRF